MDFQNTLLRGTFIKRYKRFFADMILDCGTEITAHCPSTGSMRGLLNPGAVCYVRHIDDPKRKLKYTWEMVENNGTLVGINTQNPNRIVADLLKSKKIPKLADYEIFKPEVKYGENSKIDFYLTDHINGAPPCFLEVKNVHDRHHNGYGIFPDSVTTRGQKHLKELILKVGEGYRCMVIYIIQRGDVNGFAPSAFIDKVYGDLYEESKAAGVEHLAIRFALTPNAITFDAFVDTHPPMYVE